MSDVFAVISTKTTADLVVPSNGLPETQFRRAVQNFAAGTVGGHLTVGEIRLFPIAYVPPFHLPCNGETISRINYPELVEFLAPGEIEATLPESSALGFAAWAVTQESSTSGTVNTGGTPTDQGDVGGSIPADIPSGGREYDPNGYYPPWYIP